MFRRLEEYLDNLSKKENIPACDCIVYHNHEVVFRHMAGYSDLEKTKPVSASNKYMLWSATKVVTATAVMQLVEKGYLKLEDEIYKYLPEFEHMYVGDIPAKNKITVEHLLTMRGGFGYNVKIPEIQEVVQNNLMATTEEVIRGLAKAPLLFEPGTHFKYSFCHDVLARLIEVVSGMKYSVYMKKHIFEPLGMLDTTFSIDEALPNLTQQYIMKGEPQELTPMEPRNFLRITPCYESGGAGMLSTVDDYGKFVEAMCNYGVSSNGVRILSVQSINQMRKNRLDKTCLKDFEIFGLCGYGYGLGVRTHIDEKVSGSLSPLGEFGWDGAAGSYVLIDVENNIGIFYAQQVRSKSNTVTEIHPSIRNMVYEAIY